MSTHPLGPWTQTVQSNTLNVYGTPVLFSDGGSSPTTSYGAVNSIMRSGYNSGGPSVVPRAASLASTVTTVKGWSAQGEQFKGSKPWKEASCASGLSKPFATGIPTTTLATSSVQSESQTRFIQKQGAAFNGIPFIGQFGSFKNDVRSCANLLVGRHNESYQLLVKNLLKNKNGSAKDLLRVVSDHWLTYQFGIKPDLADMHDLIAGVKSLICSDQPVVRVHGSSKEVETSSKASTYVNQWFTIKCTTSIEYTVIGKTGASYKMTYPHKDQAFAHTFGLDFGDFVPGAWELLPWSWLVGYFINVGDFIDLLSLHRGVFENGWQVIISNKLLKSVQEPYSIGDTYYRLTSGTPGVVVVKTFTFTRSPLNIDTMAPSLEFTVPSLTQAANIAAVAATKLIKPNSINNIIQRTLFRH